MCDGYNKFRDKRENGQLKMHNYYRALVLFMANRGPNNVKNTHTLINKIHVLLNFQV